MPTFRIYIGYATTSRFYYFTFPNTTHCREKTHTTPKHREKPLPILRILYNILHSQPATGERHFYHYSNSELVSTTQIWRGLLLPYWGTEYKGNPYHRKAWDGVFPLSREAPPLNAHLLLLFPPTTLLYTRRKYIPVLLYIHEYEIESRVPSNSHEVRFIHLLEALPSSISPAKPFSSPGKRRRKGHINRKISKDFYYLSSRWTPFTYLKYSTILQL